MLHRLLLTGFVIALANALVATASAAPPDVIVLGPPPPSVQSIQLYTPPKPAVAVVAQTDSSYASPIQAHVLPLDEPVSAQAPLKAGAMSPSPTVEPPPSVCMSYTGGPCVTLCNDGSWSGSTGSGTCSGHGGEASAVPVNTAAASAPGSTLLVGATLSGNCSGMEGLSVTVTDASGSPVQGAAVSVHIQLSTTAQNHDLPPTDASGQTHGTMDVGSPSRTIATVWTITASSSTAAGSTDTSCKNTST
jgi:hypothetical protein